MGLAFLLSNWRTVGVLLLVGLLGSYIAVLRIQRDEARADFRVEHAAFETFKVKVAAEGEIARQRAEAIAAHDELLKEEADEEHRQALDTLRADVGRLRRERDDARSRFLPPTAAGPGSPDLACFDRAEYLGAYRDLVSEIRGAVDEGSKAVIDLNAAKRWVGERGHVP